MLEELGRKSHLTGSSVQSTYTTFVERYFVAWGGSISLYFMNWRIAVCCVLVAILIYLACIMPSSLESMLRSISLLLHGIIAKAMFLMNR